jgi:hypothetical protein
MVWVSIVVLASQASVGSVVAQADWNHGKPGVKALVPEMVDIG